MNFNNICVSEGSSFSEFDNGSVILSSEREGRLNKILRTGKPNLQSIKTLEIGN